MAMIFNLRPAFQESSANVNIFIYFALISLSILNLLEYL